LKPTSVGPVQVDECEACHGVWFDRDELRQAKDATDADLRWMDFDIWRHEDAFKGCRSSLLCPVCRKPTVVVEYGTTGVRIDYCPSCRGTWLDKGEFKKIVEALEREVVEKSVPDYVKESLEEAREVVTGPETLVSEWKDFAAVLRLMQYRLFVENPGLTDLFAGYAKITPFR
jgi:Zn-finger nucleic acid-binding protein